MDTRNYIDARVAGVEFLGFDGFMHVIDAYVANEAEFPILGTSDYFNHAGISPWPRATRDAVAAFGRDFGINPMSAGDAWKAIGDCRALASRMLNAQESEVALVRNTADAISAIASAIDWKPGDRIVLGRCEYPANVYPWQAVAQRAGAEIVWVEERVHAPGPTTLEEDDVLALADHPRTRLVALSHVQWLSGQRMDVARIGTWCRSRGVLLALDIIQSLGVIPVDVRAMHVDFAMGGGHKWLMCPPGAGVLYVRRESQPFLRPLIIGADSVKQGWSGPTAFDLKEDATVFENGTPALANLVGMRSSLTVLLECGISAIEQRVMSLCEHFARGIEACACVNLTPMDRRAGAIVFRSDRIDAATLVKRLKAEHNVEIAERHGRPRFSPHFYNTDQQVDRAVAAVRAIVE
jgi:selenocysteine lyase/cysteine desulfurase